jgi:hypothetical protein
LNPSTYLQVEAEAWYYQQWLDVDTSVYVDGDYRGSTCSSYLKIGIDPGYHTVEVGSEYEGVPFECFDGYAEEENPVNVSVTASTITYLTAYYAPKYCLSISAGTGGSASPTGDQYYFFDTYAEVTAYENEDYEFDHWLLDEENAGSNTTISVYMDDDHELEALFSYNGSQYCLSISSGTGGTTNPSGTQFYDPESFAEVTAIPSGNYEFDYWLLDEENAGSNTTINVYMDDDHDLEAVFEPYHWLTVYAYDYGFETQLPVGVTIDSGEWSGTAGDSFYVPEGYHTVEVDDDISYQGQYYWFFFFGGYPYEQNGVYVLVDSDTELYAVYLY